MPTLVVGYHGMGRIAKQNQDPTSLDVAASTLGLDSVRSKYAVSKNCAVCLADWHPIATFRSVCCEVPDSQPSLRAAIAPTGSE